MNLYYKNVFTNGQEENGRSVLPQPQRVRPEPGIQPTGAPPPAASVRMNMPTAPVAQEADIYTYPQNLKDALDMLEDAIGREAQERVFFEFLVNAAPTQSDRDIIQGIIRDEREHYNLFRQIYTHLSGREAPVPNPQNVAPGIYTYCEGLQLALLADDQDIADYGRILFALQDRRTINMMTRILLDEIRHTGLFNYLYAKNMCPSQSGIQY